MLLVAPVRDERRNKLTSEQQKLRGIDRLGVSRSDVPAVTHVDYTARVQTVNAQDHHRYHRLISEFKKLTGQGIIVNTSFNVRGEPIVCTPEDAYECFMRTEMDVLVLEDCILYKDGRPPLEYTADSPRNDAQSRRGGRREDSPRSTYELRRFGFVMAGALALLGTLGAWRGSGVSGYVLGTALGFVGMALLYPRALGSVERVWMTLAGILSVLTTRVILMAMFVLIITPVGLLVRILGGDAMGLKPNPGASTYWVPLDRAGPASRSKKPF